MNVLEKIIADKLKEVEQRKSEVPESALRQMKYFGRSTLSLRGALQRKKGGSVIAEFKRRSPSVQDIHIHADVLSVCAGYVSSGAVALSVLTDKKYFGGSLDDLQQVRDLVEVPLLRKDFIIDHYQLVEAKAYGADVVLLIAASLTPQQVKQLTTHAHEFGMEVLLEVHSAEEWEENAASGADVVGVNNRNLHTMEVNVGTSLEMAKIFPAGTVRISESGIRNVDTAMQLVRAGYSGFLIGEYFMAQNNPGRAACDFINSLEKISHAVED